MEKPNPIRLIALLFFLLFSFCAIITTPLLANSKSSAEQNDLLLSSETVENIHAASTDNGFTVSWNLPYQLLPELEENHYQLQLAYNYKLEAERLEKGYSATAWTILNIEDLMQTQYVLQDLDGGEDYVYKLGLTDGTQTTWSATQSISTNKAWGIFEFLVLLGSLGMFLYGMTLMNGGLQQAAGAKLRNILGSMTTNRFKGVLTGFGITALVQSSSVTTVMTVSFVNAGVLTLMQSAGVVMGANIGTTFTAWLVDIFGFKVDITPYTLIMLAIGLPLLFLNTSKTKGWANAIIGFALLFMGLGFLKSAVPDLDSDSSIVQFFMMMNNIPYISSLLFVLFGALLTIIIQSSSATLALTMTLMASGMIPFEIGAAMVLGENIGTTITAELAAMVGNVHARRTARIHSAFNIIGVGWVLLSFPFFLKAVTFLTENIAGGNPILEPLVYGSTGLAVLHTTFNLANVLLMIWFVPQLVRYAEKSVKPKGNKDQHFQLEYLGKSQNLSPSIMILEAQKELRKFGDIAGRMSGFTQELLFEKQKKKQRKFIERIEKYEDITDKLEVEIANYLNKISGLDVDRPLAIRINGMNRIASNLERIGDLFYQISKIIEKKNEEGIYFTHLQNQRLVELFNLVDEAFSIMNENFNKPSSAVNLNRAKEVENRINMKRDEIRQEYYTIMTQSNSQDIKSGLLYGNIFGGLERIGDHIINVSEGVLGKV